MRARRSVRPVRALAGLLLAAALALTGCTGSGDDSGGASGDSDVAQSQAKEAAPGAAADDAAGGGTQATTAPELPTSHIIRTAELTVQVKNVPKALEAARTATVNAGGYVGKESTFSDKEGTEETQVTLRVPADRYEEVLAELEGSGKLLERTAKAQDVTEQVVDVESRIKTQRASVARIRS